MTVTKAEKDEAFRAGYALPSVQWPEDASDEQRTPGIHHCPFSNEFDPELRIAWAEGLKAALGQPTKDPTEIIAELDEAIGAAP